MCSYNKFATNCPKFAIGCCKKDEKDPCPYYYHKTCIDNYLCDNPECKYGHGISVAKREIIYYIDIDRYKNDYFDAKKEDKCKMAMNCTDKNCKLKHRYAYEDREFIYMIANNNMKDSEAWDKYNEKYLDEEQTASKIMSNSSTVTVSPVISVTDISPSPLTNSYASLFIKKNEDISNCNDISMMMEQMINIRLEMTNNIKHKNTINDKIKKLQEELTQFDKKINGNKDQLKELATKFADI